MEQRLATYAKRYQLQRPAVQELVSLVHELIKESMATGTPLVKPMADADWHYDTVIPQSDVLDGDAGTMLPDLVRSLAPSKRYEDLGYLGVGSMGEVRQVRDRHLKRVVAMKVMREELLEDFTLLARFIEEAQATAQLQHPGIVPLHDLGQFEDGRYYFTMKEIKGHNLSFVVEELHQQSKYHGRWTKTQDGWTFHRLISAFRDVCEAVGYAHSRGVLHRDIKPENVMLGAHGEILVVDWGLVKVKAPVDAAASDEGTVDTVRAKEQRFATKVGMLTGTPMYMSPEQAKGDTEIDARSDVYALGALLYEVMSGRPPYIADTWMQVMELLLEGPPPPLLYSQEELQKIWAVNPYFRPPLPLPDALVEICQKAMARDPNDRYQDAEALAQAVEEWLEGEQKREEAGSLVEAANAQQTEVTKLLEQAEQLREQVASEAEAIDPWAPEDEKKPLWEREDEADQLELEAERKAQEVELLLQEALVHDPQLLEARVALAESCLRHHSLAEAQGRDHARVRAEQMLRKQRELLPKNHDMHKQLTAYLEGEGMITVITDPPGADVRVYQYKDHNRRLMPTSGQPMGHTPLNASPMAMGQYMLLLHKSGYEEIRYPVQIRRQEHWDGLPPGSAGPADVVILPLMNKGELAPDDCYVPPGWFWSGGDPDAANSLPSRRLWLDGFVIKQYPVTLLQYQTFLNYLWAEGRLDEALRHAPRLPAHEESGQQGELVYLAFDERKGFIPDTADGIGVTLEWPVTYVDVAGARAYAQWYSGAKGQRWTLPDELVWEKAARGVDGRSLPWGDWLDPSWCCMLDSRPDIPAIDVVDSWSTDKSVYGVRGMAGNVSDWCSNAFRPDGPRSHETRARGEAESHAAEYSSGGPLDDTSMFTVRGGAWNEGPIFCNCASRFGALAFGRYNNVGFRLMRWA